MINYAYISKDESEALKHYGVLGMRWGVRRYQDKGGSYTKKGLARYRQSEEKYKQSKNLKKLIKDIEPGAVNDTKKGSFTIPDKKTKKKMLRESSSMVRSAKREMKRNYKQLKRDYLADQGKTMYAEGKRITANSNLYSGIVLGTSLATYASSKYFQNSYKRIRGVPVNVLAPALVAAGGAVIEGIVYGKNAYENKRLRAYYAH